jgi:hypothetical protein
MILTKVNFLDFYESSGIERQAYKFSVYLYILGCHPFLQQFFLVGLLFSSMYFQTGFDLLAIVVYMITFILFMFRLGKRNNEVKKHIKNIDDFLTRIKISDKILNDTNKS